MWRIIGILILFILFSPLAVGAADPPTLFKCVCTYKQLTPDTKECTKDGDLEVDLGKIWKIDLKETKFLEQPNQTDVVIKTAKGLFNPKEECPDLLESAFKAGVICGSYNCHLEGLKWVKAGAGGAYPIGGWKPWYELKWDTALSTEDNPIKVKEGESKTVEVKASGVNASIKITCLNCNPAEGTSVENLGGGKASVKFDTSKKDWLTGKVEFKIQASVNDPAAPASLLGSVWFDVEGVASLPTGADVDAWISSQYGEPPGYSARGGAIPKCAFSGTCRNINNLLELIINFASGMFAIIGSFAFAFFVYGGFKMIVSMGSPEKVKSGRDAMIAAVIGMVIAFSAYAAINLLLTTLGVEPDSGFREIN